MGPASSTRRCRFTAAARPSVVGLRLAYLSITLIAWRAVTVRAQDAAAPAPIESKPRVLVVIGAPGTDEYTKAFTEWAGAWGSAAERGGADFTLIGGDAPATGASPAATAASEADSPADAASTPATDAAVDDRERLRQFLAEHSQRGNANALWLVLIGHGSFDGETAKLNLRGPDVALAELAAWLDPIASPLAVIDCTSASGPLIALASRPSRVVITATKSGFELNYARFGEHLSRAIADVQADLDKDGQTSLLEAYLTACRGVAEFYAADGRLATEHALLDDNGDALGTPADWFRGLRATRQAKAGAALDGQRAHQFHLIPSNRESELPPAVRTRRDELELQIAALRDRKATLDQEAYYAELEPLLIGLAQLYARGESALPSTSTPLPTEADAAPAQVAP